MTRTSHGRPVDAAGLVAIASIAFLTLVDLFAAQAILPALAHHYDVSASTMGLAVNASTFGMAVASVLVAILAPGLPRRTGVVVSLLLLAVPTSLLAHAPTVTAFAALRVMQGLCMAAAFALTLADLGERIDAMSAAAAAAAYVTGNVASNLIGRLLAAGAADYLGLSASFYVFALLNLAGASLAAITLGRGPRSGITEQRCAAPHLIWAPALAAACGIGFCILFAFLGTFTYVSFVLMRPPHALGQMMVGLVYLVFLPSLMTTPLAGPLTRRWGSAVTVPAALAVAGIGLPLLLLDQLAAVLAGLVLVAAGTFLAQAVMTGVVSRLTGVDRAAASGFYLASYFLGGLVGAALLGQLFDRYGWPATVLGVASALTLAAALTMVLSRHLDRPFA